MKKILFLISVCFIIGMAKAQYTTIPDTNFESYLEANGMGDGIDNNGLVLTANIDTVTELDVQFQGIADLTGIEGFIALEYLSCGSNGLDTLDLSQNVALEILGCDNNFLTSLSLSQNIALTHLYCVVNNLTSLDLSQNINLEEVYCDENYLTSLTIASPALTWLWCNFNQITSLDLSSCPLLTNLYATYNQLSSVDVSNSTALETLGLGANNLINLDISQNTQLLYFYCSFNNITSLDISQNILLKELSCTNNNLTSLDLSQNANLKILRAYNNSQLGSLDIRNGNNVGIEYFNATNSNLDCVFVDDASAEYLDDWHIDSNTTFVNNEQECEDLSVLSFSQDNFNVYPNPVQNELSVITTTRVNYTILTTQGKIVNTGVLQEGKNSLNLTSLSSGMYFLKTYAKYGVTTKKVIKE